MEKNHKPYNVLVFEINGGGSFGTHDVMPYFMRCWDEVKDSKSTYSEDRYRGKPANLDELKKWLEDRSRYMYWSRCEWELIVCGWPCTDVHKKIDVHEQLMMNIDLLAEVFCQNIKFQYI